MASVMVVEDEPLIATDIKTALAAMGHTVVASVRTGEQALARAAELRPDVVLMDVVVAGHLDGAQTGRAIHESFGIPVVYLTSSADDASLRRARDSDACVYLVKPVAARDLKAAIDLSLSKLQLIVRLQESEERYRRIVEAAIEGVWTTDAEGRTTFVNRRMAEMLGYTPDEIVARPPFDFIPPEAHALVRERLARRPRSTSERHETQLRRRDGSTLWVSLSTTPILDSGGRYAGALAMVTDVTDSRRAEEVQQRADEAARRAHRDFRAVIEAIPDAVSIDRDRVLVYVNPAYATTLGYDHPAELVGRRVDALLHPEELPRYHAQFAAGAGAVDDETRAVSEWRLLRKDGQTATIEFTRRRTIEFEGAPAVITVGRNLTERKRIEGRLLLADRMVSLGTMAAGVAHEINNPLAYVLSNLDLAARELPEAVRALEQPEGDVAEPSRARGAVARQLTEITEAIDDARQGAARVRNIVRDLKTFSRASDESRGLVHLQGVIEATINLAWNEIRHRARLVKDYGDVPPIDANESRLGQVVLNLLFNAAQAIPEGQAAHNEIRIVTRTDAAGRAVFEVRDSGTGIAPDILPRIFDPFFTTKPIGAGTGLGLSICHSIVTGYGGEITAESAPGHGSVVRVALPPGRLKPPTAPPPAVVSSAPGVRRGRVLVVDDDALVVVALRRALQREHDVVTETNGRGALARLQSGERFDVVFCDLMMPDMTGMDVHAALHATAPRAADEIVFLTGGAFTPAARAFLDRVGNLRVEKPFDLQSLRTLIRDRLR